MKKIVGIIGVAMIAFAMFFNTSITNKSKIDLDLSGLVALNEAQAEIIIGSTTCSYIGFQSFSCSDGPFTFTGCIPDPSLGCMGYY